MQLSRRKGHLALFRAPVALRATSSLVQSISWRFTHTGSTNGPVTEWSPLNNMQRKPRLIIGVTGATGIIFSIRLLEVLRQLDIETHLIFSKWALATMKYETDLSSDHVQSLATKSYVVKDMSAPPSSGSFLHDGMIIVPCSMKTLAAVRTGLCDDLISRSADVCLKERRKLVLAVRETPLSAVHLDNMAFLERAGATIFPPVPAFYTKSRTIDDLVNQSVGRMLDLVGIHVGGFKRWEGMQKS